MTSLADRKVVSFFTGAMGLDIGLQEAGLDIIVGQEIDPEACKTIRANGHEVVEGDLKNLLSDDPDLADFMKKFGIVRGEPFAVVGGPPCQPFSTAGKRKGVADVRGTLIYDYLMAVKALRPRFVILENVKGILGASGRGDQSLIGEVQELLDAIGYRSLFGVVDASHYGAPQFRERVILIATRDGEEVFLPRPTHFQFHQDPNYRWRTLRSAIEDLELNPGPGLEFSRRTVEYIQQVPEGGNWKSLSPSVGKEAMGGAWLSGGGKVGFYRRLRYDEPSPTLVTSPVQKATLLAHPKFDRPLSIREYARIQGFPDSWEFVGKISSLYRQIGNAVPVPLGKAIGQMLTSVADGGFEIQTKRRRGTKTHDILFDTPINQLA